jgi:hypothetical protein
MRPTIRQWIAPTSRRNHRTRLSLELLESRETPSVSIVAQTFRPLDFKLVNGQFAGTTTGPDYSDTFGGTFSANGQMNYTSPNDGTGTVSGSGAGSGQNVFGGYTFKFTGRANISEAASVITTTPVTHSFTYTSGGQSGSGGGGDPFGAAADGSFDPQNYVLSGQSDVIEGAFEGKGGFTATVQQSSTSPTEIAVKSAKFVNCNVTFEVDVTGQLMHAASEDTPATDVRLYYADVFGNKIGGVQDTVPIFWNQGTLKVDVDTDSWPAPPPDTREILIIADEDHVATTAGNKASVAKVDTLSSIDAVAKVVHFAYPKSINEGAAGQQILSFASSMDGPNGPDCIHYAFDLDGDGINEYGGDSYDTGLTSNNFVLPPSFYADGPVNHQIHATAFGKFGGKSIFSVVIPVNNVAPTASFAGVLIENTPGTVSFTNQADPSQADIDAGFHYAYDFNNDGKWDVGDGSYANSPANASQNITADMLPDGNAKKFVKGRIIDKDGGFTDYLVNVANQSPTASFGNNGPIDEGSKATVSFSGQSDAPADVTAGFHYAYDLNNDGKWDVGSPTYAGGVKSASATITIPDNGTQVVRARIIDKDGGYSEYFTTVTVNSVAPTAKFGNNVKGQVNEGGKATVSFTGATDVSPVDKTKGFRYAYDFNNDGTWDVGDGTYAGGSTATSQAVPPALLADGPATVTVKARIIDKDGAATDYTTTINVLNVAPTATLKNNGPKAVGQDVTFTFSGMMDPSAADMQAGFSFSFDFTGTGTFTDNGNNPVATHAFDKAGPHKVTGRITDKDGGSRDYTTTVTIH